MNKSSTKTPGNSSSWQVCGTPNCGLELIIPIRYLFCVLTVAFFTLGVWTQHADADEPAWVQPKLIALGSITKTIAPPEQEITVNQDDMPRITPENCAGLPITILCVGASIDSNIMDSCNQTKAWLEAQGCDTVTIRYVEPGVNPDDIRGELANQKVIILDSHGISKDGSFVCVDRDENPVFNDTDICSLIPKDACFLANACYSGALGPINCEMYARICTGREIEFSQARKQAMKILPYLITKTPPIGKSCSLIPAETEQVYTDACHNQGGTYSNEGRFPAKHTLKCRIRYDDMCKNREISAEVEISNPAPTGDDLDRCQVLAAEEEQEDDDDGMPTATSGCKIINRSYSVESTQAEVKACCDNAPLNALPYPDEPGTKYTGGLSPITYAGDLN